MLEVREGTRDMDKGCIEAKGKRAKEGVRQENAVIDWRGR